jgi:hypothetical protein
MEQDFVIDILNEEAVKDLVVNICLVLSEFGITEVHVGGLMRLIGIEEELAAEHDDELMVITDIQQLQKSADDSNEIIEVVPPGTTLH